MQAPLPGGSPRGSGARGDRLRPEAEQEAGRDAGLRPHRGPPVQPHVQDAHRRRRGDGARRVPAPRDGAGHLRQLQERRADRPAQAAVRDRADREGLPERDHAGELHLPHARVRADGDGVLRPARGGGAVVPLLDRRAHALVPPLRDSGGEPPRPATRGRRALALLERHERHRVPLPHRLVGARGDREPRRLRPERAHGRLRNAARVGRLGDRRALRPARGRACGGREQDDARVPRRLVRRGGRRRPPADGAPPPSGDRAREGRRASAHPTERGHRGPRRSASTRSSAGRSSRSTTTRARSAGATAARTRSGRRSRSRSTSRPSRTTR